MMVIVLRVFMWSSSLPCGCSGTGGKLGTGPCVNRAVPLERAFGAPLSSEATAAGDGYFEYGVLDRA